MLKSPNLQHYLNSEPTKGIIRVYNIQSEKTLLLISKDIIEDSKNIRFQLDLGFYDNQELQSEYSEIGLEVFAIDPFIIQKDDEDLDILLEKAKNILQSKNILFY
ncbi:MAG: hypothetical protein ACPKM0_09005 [Pleomorphochaeta sp.]